MCYSQRLQRVAKKIRKTSLIFRECGQRRAVRIWRALHDWSSRSALKEQVSANLAIANPWENADQDRAALAAQTVYFEFDRSAIKVSEQPKLDAVATFLKSNQGSVQLVGRRPLRRTRHRRIQSVAGGTPRHCGARISAPETRDQLGNALRPRASAKTSRPASKKPKKVTRRTAALNSSFCAAAEAKGPVSNGFSCHFTCCRCCRRLG